MRVLVLGCFDLTHAGHFDHFKLARQQGDELHVGVAHDALVRAFKGVGRPIFELPERCAIIQACRHVTSVKVYGDENSNHDTNEADMKALVKLVRPHVFCEGQDSADRGGVLPGYLEGLGIKRVVFPRLSPKIKTSYYIKKMRSIDCTPPETLPRDIGPHYFPWGLPNVDTNY